MVEAALRQLFVLLSADDAVVLLEQSDHPLPRVRRVRLHDHLPYMETVKSSHG